MRSCNLLLIIFNAVMIVFILHACNMTQIIKPAETDFEQSMLPIYDDKKGNKFHRVYNI